MGKIRFSGRSFLLMLLMLIGTGVFADKQTARQMPKDSLTVRTSKWPELPSGQMAHSAYPVQLKVKGRSLRITSKYEQVLPIYTKGGTLYLAMQLNPGVNWLNGLPRGRYRINNRTINIK